MVEQLRDAELDPLGELAEEFLMRWRQGEPTSVESFALEHPELASGIRALFPTLILLEANRPDAVGFDVRRPPRGAALGRRPAPASGRIHVAS